MGRALDIAGNRFGRWTAISPVSSSKQGVHWKCACDCGTEAVVPAGKLRAGESKSCGCLRVDTPKTFHRKHGHSPAGTKPSKTYSCWDAMIQRCTNPNNHEYQNYGGRGIAVCDRWMTFAGFLADMGEKPASLTLDRVDVNGNYEPGNCRWITNREQQRNKRNNRLTIEQVREIRRRSAAGESRAALAREMGVNASTVSKIATGKIWHDEEDRFLRTAAAVDEAFEATRQDVRS